MAPPDYANFGTFTDTEFRDIFHRRQHQIVPTGNVIQKLHTHYDTANAAPILSSIQASSMDATNTQGAWNLLLRSATNPLSGESITTANAAAWTANAIISATPSLTTLRSANVQVTSNLNTNVVTSNALTSTKLTVTDTAVVGNLQVLGSVNFGRNITQSFNRQLLGAIGSTADICDIDTYNGTATIQLSIVAAGGLAKLYHFAISNDQDTGGAWQRLMPISANDYREVVVEIRSTGALSADTRFRIVRVGTATTGSFTCHFTVYYNTDETFNFIPLTTVESGVTPSTAIFKASVLAQVNGRVGINTDNPSTTLDVVGAAKVSGNVTSGNLTVSGTGNVFALRATTFDVLGMSNVQALTAVNITTGNLSTGNLSTGNASVGNLNAIQMVSGAVTSNALTSKTLTITETAVVGNLQVLGSVNFGRNITQSFNRQLLGAIGSTANICDIDTYNGTATIQLSIVAAGGLAKLYHFAISNDQDTGGAWQRLLPISANDYREVVVEIKSTGALSADTSFRLVRVGTATTGSFTCHFTVYYNTDETFNFIQPTILQESGVSPSTAIFKASVLAQVNGRVGINTDNPSTTLDVVGAAKVSGNVTSGNLTVSGTGNVFALRATTFDVLGTSSVKALTATTIDTQNITTSGNTKSGNATVFTQADPTTFNFSDKMRFYYNSAADALEIQRNIAGTWTKTATLAV